MLASQDGALYAGGDFGAVNGKYAWGIARYNAQAWGPLGLDADASGLDGAARCATTWDPDGAGPAQGQLVVGGDFTASLDGVTLHGIGRWTGSHWQAMGDGFNARVLAVKVWNGRLYAGGDFDHTFNGSQLNYLAVWDEGSGSWLPIPVGAEVGLNQSVHALEVFNDGSGAHLYAGGNFNMAGPVQASGVARLSSLAAGAFAWSAVGAGFDGSVEALKVHSDAAGTRLYAGGGFGFTGTTLVNRIAAWNGTTWAGLGSGVNGPVFGLESFDEDGGGSLGAKLVAVGTFTGAGSLPGGTVNRVARWNGATWERLGSVTGDGNGFDLPAYAVAAFGGSLLVGGEFRSVDSSVSADHVARLGCLCYANCDLSTAAPILNANDFQCFLNKFAAADPYSNCDGSTAAPILNANDFQCFLNAYAAGCR
jgi:hypothetical protein